MRTVRTFQRSSLFSLHSGLGNSSGAHLGIVREAVSESHLAGVGVGTQTLAARLIMLLRRLR